MKEWRRKAAAATKLEADRNELQRDGASQTAEITAGKPPARGCSAGRVDANRPGQPQGDEKANALLQTAILLGGNLAVEITMKELLEAGVHFGHQTRRWNPKMKEYIFGERNGIHIIDLQKTLKMFREASRFVSEISAQGRNVLFVGTKRQAQEAVAEESKRCSAFFVNHRWLGGTLTNWATLQKSIKRLKLLKAMNEDGRIKELSKKEQARLDREMKHLQQNLEGIENMTQLPDAMFVIDSNAEEIAVKEARRMGVPVVSVVDTNCDPDVVDWIIPGNDDALRAIRLFTTKIADSVLEGHNAYQQSQVADQKAAADQAIVEGVEYVDTSAYEQYEKQEGDFVEGVAETPAEAADAAEATVPPDEETH